MDPIVGVTAVYHVANLIYVQVEQVKVNKRQCTRLKERIQIIEGAIRGLDSTFRKRQYDQGLDDLIMILQRCLNLVQDFSKNGPWFYKVLKAGSHGKAFKELTEELQRSLQVLTLGLVAQQILNDEGDKLDFLEDMRFLRGHRERILRLNQEALERVKPLALEQTERQALLSLQLASVKRQMHMLTKEGADRLCEEENAIGYYDLGFERKIAEGSLTRIYRGRWENQVVAIKTLRGILSSSAEEQFQREVAIVRRLKHPQIVSFYGASLEQGHACMVMEYTDHQSSCGFSKNLI